MSRRLWTIHPDAERLGDNHALLLGRDDADAHPIAAITGLSSALALLAPLASPALTGTPTIGGNAIWHAGNDGASSGLDADLLDGQHGSYYRDAGNLNAGTLAAARLPIAGASTLGGVMVGTGLAIDGSGVLSATGGGSYSLPTASASVLGGVKVGTGLAIDGAGVLSATGGGGGVSDHPSLTGRSTADSHPTSAITGLDTALAGKVPTTRQVITGNGISGGGALSGDLTLHVGATAGLIAFADQLGIDFQATAPASIGTANSAGSSGYAPRLDHVHAHGNQAGGSLHADAIASGASGFMSGSDKDKLDNYPSTPGGISHNTLTLRNQIDSHPTGAITGLDAALADKLPMTGGGTVTGNVTVKGTALSLKDASGNDKIVMVTNDPTYLVPTLLIGPNTGAGALDLWNYRSWQTDGTYGFKFTTKGSGAAASDRLKITGNLATAEVQVVNANLTVNGNTAWHAGNDGAGSGLDADTVDGQHASAFAAASHTQAATTITEDTTHRFITDAERTAWNAKQAALGFTPADSARTLTAGAGLTGGGTLAADRTFAVGAGTGILVNADDVAVDFVASGTSSATKAVRADDSRLSDARTPVAHNQAWSTITSTPTTLAGYAISDATPSSRTVTAGAGLTGGGDLSANRTLDVGAGLGITVAADSVAVDFAASGVSSATKAVRADDSRLSDARTPLTHTHANATTSIPGFMSATDKATLDSLAASGGVPLTRTITATGLLTGGGALSSDLIIDLDPNNVAWDPAAQHAYDNVGNPQILPHDIVTGAWAVREDVTETGISISSYSEHPVLHVQPTATSTDLVFQLAAGGVNGSLPQWRTGASSAWNPWLEIAVLDSVTTPQTVGSTNSIGTSSIGARVDHAHAHGNQAANGFAHAAATTSVAGFMSSGDKTKLDGIATGATANTAASATPQPIGTATVGAGTAYARDNHVHAHGNQASDGNMHAAATSSVAGFMPAADKAKLDTITSTTLKRSRVAYDWCPKATFNTSTSQAVATTAPINRFDFTGFTEYRISIDVTSLGGAATVYGSVQFAGTTFSAEWGTSTVNTVSSATAVSPTTAWVALPAGVLSSPDTFIRGAFRTNTAGTAVDVKRLCLEVR